jgi:serine/threonine protein phosphatase 1
MIEARIFVMGDIHGANKALVQCLERCKFNNDIDTLIQLGDVADGWSETSECVDTLLSIKNLISLRGNHDVWMYDWINFGTQPLIWTQQGGKATIDSYIRTGKLVDESHRQFWNDQVNWVKDNQNRLFIHAGWAYMDEGDFNRQASFPVNAGSIAKECHWDRSVYQSAKTAHFTKNRFKTLEQFKEVFIGHTSTSSSKPENYLNLWNLDSGCGWKGKLTIMDVETKEYWQSDTSKELYPNEIGR